MDPGKAVFEIVETEGIEEFEEVKTFISEIRKRGAKIAIDDFGTGYSNFEYLLNMNVDYLKIDGSLIQNICSERNFEIMAETIVNFSSRLGIKTIGEFVSEKIIHDKVVELGIDYSQGYYFSKPISLNTLKKSDIEKSASFIASCTDCVDWNVCRGEIELYNSWGCSGSRIKSTTDHDQPSCRSFFYPGDQRPWEIQCKRAGSGNA
jgi:predicted signal transduction protein with EAL and GGDEF domain